MGAKPASAAELQRTLGTDRFDIEKELGVGGMGAVYRAYDRERAQRVALKTLLELDPASLYRFKHEFRALSHVSHPNLVTLYDLVATGGQWFFTMELVRGTDFLSHVRGEGSASRVTDTMAPLRIPTAAKRGAISGPPTGSPSAVLTAAMRGLGAKSAPEVGCEDPTSALPLISGPDQPTVGISPMSPSGPDAPTSVVVRREGPAPVPPPAIQVVAPVLCEERLRSAAIQLAEALAALHRTGHLHRDVKPSNVMVTPEGRVVVLDFGVITELSKRHGTSKEIEVAGTPAYMAPETLQPDTVPSPASDWYAFGVMLFEALVGRRPFVGGTETVLWAKHAHLPPVHLLSQVDAPPDLAELCGELLDPDPEKRPGARAILGRLGGGGALVERSPGACLRAAGRGGATDRA